MKCSNCGIDKVDVAKSIVRIEKMVKILSSQLTPLQNERVLALLKQEALVP